jgi:cytochrome P450
LSTQELSDAARLTNDFDPLKPEAFHDAHDMYREMRAKCPVAHSEAYNGFWAVFGYDDVVACMKDSATFITSVQNVVPKVAFTGRRPPLHLDPPAHTPYRHVLTPFFTPARVAAHELEIRRNVVTLLEGLIAKRNGDFCKDFSYKLPGFVLASVFNMSNEMSMRIRHATAEFNNALQDFVDDEVKRTSLMLYDCAKELIEDRKKNPLDPRQDMVSAFLAARPNGQAFPEEMILGTIRQLIVVGMIAPSTWLGSVAVHLSENPDIYNMLKADLSLVPAAVDEYLRLLTPYRGFARTATKDVVIGGRLIKKDEPIAMVFASANQDEKVFPDSGKFILNRPNIRDHVAFGMGPHQCVGAPLALLILKITLEELLSRTESLKVTGPLKMTQFPEWGPLSVPVAIEPAQ